ncbi:hypothetical protein ED733_005234 [Metarhizium rileyi]|uniref:Zinc finger PHD-type domain-containing protein n=1 Tax=Metarhizium rileyi (strain RCEF 4871) TaxID=1649241 RepID=A0A5C6GCG9_METRR|nr:hypothetical protein ED733_005234 [Metarhizium rileyi]
MPSRKRATHPAGDDRGVEPPSTLHRIRNMWQFANLCQWIYIFGKAAKIDETIDIEEIETDCLKPQQTLLADIALALLKMVSAHRGLTPAILDEHLRKHFSAKAREQNPFGDESDPVSFSGLDVFTKIKILQKLTQWTMIHPERLREKMTEHKDAEQIKPRNIESRQKTKKTDKSRASRRAGKRRCIASSSDDGDDDMGNRDHVSQLPEDDLGGGSWECIAITLHQANALIDTLMNTRDANEKILREQLETHLLPILEKEEEMIKRKELQRERELLNLAKMANAKRSSRIADKAEKRKRDVKEEEEQRQKLVTERAEHRERLAQIKLQQERDRRMYARQRRLRERESRRVRHEEELAHLSEDSKHAHESARISERHLHAEIRRNQRALKDIEREEDEWVFDCVCGLYGQIDDGTHSVACDCCNVWQHSRCLGIREDEAEQRDFHFICSSCRRQEDEKTKSPKTIIKIKVPPSNITSNANVPTGGVSYTGSEVEQDSFANIGRDESTNNSSPLLLQRRTQCAELKMVSIEVPPPQATISQFPLVRHGELCEDHRVPPATITALPKNQALPTYGSSTAKQAVSRNSQVEGSAQLSLPSVDTKALSSAPYLASSEGEYSALPLKQVGYSSLTQQSPTILTLVPPTKKNLGSCMEDIVERKSPSASDSLSCSVTPVPATPGFVSTPIRPSEEHEAG